MDNFKSDRYVTQLRTYLIIIAISVLASSAIVIIMSIATDFIIAKNNTVIYTATVGSVVSKKEGIQITTIEYDNTFQIPNSVCDDTVYAACMGLKRGSTIYIEVDSKANVVEAYFTQHDRKGKNIIIKGLSTENNTLIENAAVQSNGISYNARCGVIVALMAINALLLAYLLFKLHVNGHVKENRPL